MDTRRFDDMVRRAASGASRRGMLGTGLRLLAAAPLAALGAGSGDLAAAKKKKRVKVCLDGETIQIRRKKRKFYLSLGATRGACRAGAPPPNVPPPPPGCPACGICEECSAGTCQPKAAGSPCDNGKVCQGGECVCRSAHTPCQELCCTECQRCDEADFLCIMEPGSDGNNCEGGTCCGGACCPGSCQCGLTGLAGAAAPYVADFFELPYPFCSKAGSGSLCGPGYPACPADLTCRTINVVIGGISSTIGVCADLCPGVSYPSL